MPAGSANFLIIKYCEFEVAFEPDHLINYIFSYSYMNCSFVLLLFFERSKKEPENRRLRIPKRRRLLSGTHSIIFSAMRMLDLGPFYYHSIFNTPLPLHKAIESKLFEGVHYEALSVVVEPRGMICSKKGIVPFPD